MTFNLRILIILFSILLSLTIFYIVRKGRITIKYSMFWLFSAVLVLVMGMFPEAIQKIANLLGFELASNMIFGMIIGILIFINISLTIIVSGQQQKIILLIQEIAILNEKVNK